jgi:acetyltransferase
MRFSKERGIELVTRTGLRLNVRQSGPADEPEILDFLGAVSLGDLRFRFLSAVKPSDALARLFAVTKRDSVENLLAFDANNGRLAALATIAAESSPTKAEVALIVRSDLKGQGIGWVLLSQICDLARVRGFRSIECIESSENRSAIRLEEELGFTREPHPDDATVTVLSRSLERA